MNNYFWQVFLAFVLLTESTAAVSAQLCWIDRIEKASNDMRVYFSSKSKAVVFIKRANGRNNEYGIVHGKLKDRYEGESAKAKLGLDFLQVGEGDLLQLRQGIHDTCALKAVRSPSGLVGVQADSIFAPQGFNPIKKDVFIPATD